MGYIDTCVEGTNTLVVIVEHKVDAEVVEA